MKAVSVFTPSRRNGLLFHAAALLVFLSLSGAALFFALNQGPEGVGGYFALFLLLAVLFFAPIPLLIYRAYALMRARYVLERDGLHLRWGLRAEDIPLTEVEWVRPAANLPYRLPKPRPIWPGAILGVVKTDELGVIEYMASEQENLLLVATTQRIYAVSPGEPQAFLDALQAAFEMGSLSPIPASSVLPAAYITQVWEKRAARWMLVAGLLLTLVLFIIVSLAIPNRANISLGFNPDGTPLTPVPSAQLLLLPILSLLFTFINLGLGLIFFRRPPYRLMAYLLWASSIISTILLLLAALFILQ